MAATPAPHDYAPDAPTSIAQLEEVLTAPSPLVVEAMRRLSGDLVLLGVGGKMGPTLARLARRASDAAGVARRIIGVSRFSSESTRRALEAHGIETVPCNLLDADAVARLPDAANAIYMSGFKFGASENPSLAWGMNCYAPALVARRYRSSRLVAFSTGNVYGLTTPASGGSRETDPPNPQGEYAMTTLGRERMFEYFSREHGTPTTLLRLNYATELRYGVLVDLALDVFHQQPIDLTMSHVNVIWLADANALTLCAFAHGASPPKIVNLAGAEILRVREVCERFGEYFGRPPIFTGVESPVSLLNNGHAGHSLLGQPQVDADRMIRWTAAWVARGGENLGKPTHFQVRSGKF